MIAVVSSVFVLFMASNVIGVFLLAHYKNHQRNIFREISGANNISIGVRQNVSGKSKKVWFIHKDQRQPRKS